MVNKIKISITVDEELYDKIKELAKRDTRSTSSMINYILKGYAARGH